MRPTSYGARAALVAVLCWASGAAGFALSPARAATPPPMLQPRLARTPVSPRLAEDVAAVMKEDGEKEGVAAEEDDGKMTIEKVASFGIAGILSIAVAETVFWVLSFPTSEGLYFLGTGEWIDLFSQEGQLKFLAFTAGWGALGGVIAQYRTVLTAAAMTPWMDQCAPRPPNNNWPVRLAPSPRRADARWHVRARRNVVKPYVQPVLDRFGKGEA